MIDTRPSTEDPISQKEYGGYLLSAPESFWNAVKIYPQLINDLTGGCGSGVTDYLVPDHLYFLSILLACRIHDWTFALWSDKAGFVLANTLFKNNMQRIVQQHFEKGNRGLFNRFIRDRRMKLSIVYYEAVEHLGERIYFDNKAA